MEKLTVELTVEEAGFVQMALSERIKAYRKMLAEEHGKPFTKESQEREATLRYFIQNFQNGKTAIAQAKRKEERKRRGKR